MSQIIDLENDKHYIKGKFLGKGGFAECYELINCETKEVFAVKIISKHLLIREDLKEKISQEIAIHRTLKHKNIVKFHNYFEDEENIYILLELCKHQSLVELQKKKKHITISECRIIMRQIVSAVKYLHQNGIIHRDLKPSNVLLDENYEVKVSDFGLATLVEFLGEKKKAICGTPNYISPEMLSKKGHSFEVDVWSLGCIMYTLLVGSPPFETSSVEQTYSRIARNAYYIPASLLNTARDLIKNLLHPDPSKRMKIKNIEKHEFFSTGLINKTADLDELLDKVGMMEINGNNRSCMTDVLYLNKDWIHFENYLEKLFSCEDNDSTSFSSQSSSSSVSSSSSSMIPSSSSSSSLSTIYSVNKWVDCTEKYGLSYELFDSVGLLFNDETRLIYLKQTRTLVYMVNDNNGCTTTRTTYNYIPTNLQKKFLILRYFLGYMNKHLSTAELSTDSNDKIQMTSPTSSSSLVFVVTWYRCESSIIFLLSNKTIQINFFTDHSKLVIDGKSWCYRYFDGQKREIIESKLCELKNCEEADKDLINKIIYCKTLISKINVLDN